jgi:hypothetical protein
MAYRLGANCTVSQRRRHIVIVNAIREANTERDTYVLLTAYVEAMQSHERRNMLPESVTRLPMNGKDDVMARFEKLVAGLDAASKSLDDEACLVIKEALAVFGAALDRLDVAVAA